MRWVALTIVAIIAFLGGRWVGWREGFGEIARHPDRICELDQGQLRTLIGSSEMCAAALGQDIWVYRDQIAEAAEIEAAYDDR